MKLSTAMRKGFKTTKPIRGIYLSQDQSSACPIGAAAKAVGLSPPNGLDISSRPKGTFHRFPILKSRIGKDRLRLLPTNPIRGIPFFSNDTLENVIIALFDDLKWKREKIADLLASWGL